jgi:hypothetical protein
LRIERIAPNDRANLNLSSSPLLVKRVPLLVVLSKDHPPSFVRPSEKRELVLGTFYLCIGAVEVDLRAGSNGNTGLPESEGPSGDKTKHIAFSEHDLTGLRSCPILLYIRIRVHCYLLGVIEEA